MTGMTAATLRNELNMRALEYARREKLLHALSDGARPSVIFGRDEQGRHGNFQPSVYRRICADDRWAIRLNKVHTASRKMYVRSDWSWKELDCACSSDALLMNIFCHPAVFNDARLRGLLGVAPNDRVDYGFRPRVPLHRGLYDQTEIDMKIGDMLVEAKLTETDFQTASDAKLLRYRDLPEVFGWNRESLQTMPSLERRGYQVMRGILAAHATGGRFCLMCDARRPDLIETWYAVMRHVQSAELRTRIMLITWQELVPCLPIGLQRLLAYKYGIEWS
jgi:hypothetical protein